MSEVLRGLGKGTEVPTTKTVFEVQVVERGDGQVVLESGEKVLAWAGASSTVEPHWIMGFSVIDVENDFYVRDKENAVDALEDIGRFYLAVKAGDV